MRLGPEILCCRTCHLMALVESMTGPSQEQSSGSKWKLYGIMIVGSIGGIIAFVESLQAMVTLFREGDGRDESPSG